MCGLRRKLSLFGSGMFFPEPKGTGPLPKCPCAALVQFGKMGRVTDEVVPRCGRRTPEGSTAIFAFPQVIQNPVPGNQC